jgi:hypothetical protein
MDIAALFFVVQVMDAAVLAVQMKSSCYKSSVRLPSSQQAHRS